jgi:uncharacterized repeat protein (TIGR03803 family)
MFRTLRHSIAAVLNSTRSAIALAILSALVVTGIAPQAAQAQTFQVLYSFTGGKDGLNPTGDLARDAAGNLYGTTVAGGGSANCHEGCGIVFKLDPQGTETILHSFSGTDGSNPYSVILDSAGNLYGVTTFGGLASCPGFGTCGVVFKIGTGNNFTLLHEFAGGTDGANPESSLIMDTEGNLYGTTVAGGASTGCPNQTPAGCGIIFKIDTNGNETIIPAFDGDSGNNPSAGLLLDSEGNLYGTTTNGGVFVNASASSLCCYGTVFKVDAKGRKAVLHSFSGLTPDGGVPYAQLIEDQNGNLYGTTEFHPPGSDTFGTVFKLSADGGPMTELFTFDYTDGGYPLAGLTRDSAGNLYGTTNYTTTEAGTVFELDEAGNMTILHTFTDKTDGGFPGGVLVLDGSGNLYGNAAQGGVGGGVVFKITP